MARARKAQRTPTWPADAPTAEQIARAIVAAADEFGERPKLRRITSGDMLRSTPLKCRLTVMDAIGARFPSGGYYGRLADILGVDFHGSSDGRVVRRVAASI